MSEAQAHGIGHVIEWRGSSWTMGPFNKSCQGHYEQWLKGQAWREVEEDRPLVAQGVLDPTVYKARHDSVSAMIAAREHRKGGSIYNDSWGTDEAVTRRVYLMIQQQHPDFTPDQAVLMLEEIPEVVLSRYADLMQVPNSQAGTAPAKTE